MSAVPGRSQTSSHRSPQGEGTPVSAAPGRSQASSQRSPQGEGTPVSAAGAPQASLRRGRQCTGTPMSLQRGFAAIAALFILVVLAALGAFMVSISSSQQITSAQDVQGSRAYWAARAGMEWALGSLAAVPAACPTPPGSFSIEGFSIVMGCTRSTFDEGGVTRVIYSLSSRASVGGAAGAVGFVERSVSASVEF